jgi:hypothetical protein
MSGKQAESILLAGEVYRFYSIHILLVTLFQRASLSLRLCDLPLVSPTFANSRKQGEVRGTLLVSQGTTVKVVVIVLPLS